MPLSRKLIGQIRFGRSQIVLSLHILTQLYKSDVPSVSNTITMTFGSTHPAARTKLGATSRIDAKNSDFSIS